MSEKANCPCTANCPLQAAMESVGGKWKTHILCSLYVDGPIRYNHLKRKIQGISNTMLANCLKELEQDGLVIRKEYLEVPVRVEYRTSSASNDLIPILEQLAKWQTTRTLQTNK